MRQRLLFPLLSIFIIIFFIYSNTFNSPWFFDDFPNIVDNPPLQIDNLMPETLWQTMFAKPFREGQLYRPIACLSFALNWFVGKDHIIGYHIVNIAIHFLTALFLFLTFVQLFQTPTLKGSQSPKGVYFIALLSAILWAANPIQTQAVTYIVQRMASLAGMFYIISIYFYTIGRLQKDFRYSYKYFLLCILSFFLALGSKENAVLLPMSLLLIEYTFFYHKKNESSKHYLNILSLISLILIITGVVYLYNDVFINFFDQAGSRPFSYYERLLTQSRILFLYFSLILYPIPSRLSIEHDFIISTSLFAPWTTLISVAALLIIIILSFYFIHKKPILSFPLLFFFINHLVESTVIPLELIFEHRNYIPSLFLFLPISAGLYYLFQHYVKKNRFVYIFVMIFCVFLIISFGTGTFIRNMTYASSEDLWRDALKKAPLSARALSNLGIKAGWGDDDSIAQMQLALYLNQRALNSYKQRVTHKPAIILNMGTLFYKNGFYEQAINQYRNALNINPDFTDARYRLAQAYIKTGQFSNALNEISTVIKNQPTRSVYFNVLGLSLLWMDRPEEALFAFRKAMSMIRDKSVAYYNVGAALMLSGFHDQANWFLVKARNNEKNNIRIAFSVLENSVRGNDTDAIIQHAQYIFYNFEVPAIVRALELLPYEYSSVPVDTFLINPFISSTAIEMMDNFFKNQSF